MSKLPSFPELSVIIPVLNEEAALKDLFVSLSNQVDIQFEVIFSDGGSCDNTVSLAKRWATEVDIPLQCLKAEPGRGKQLNAGVAAARGDFLLFLHADCRFDDPLALARGVMALKERLQKGGQQVAGRFALRFSLSGGGPSFFYLFYETKARLSRTGCIHGDQGMLISRHFFEEVGPFDESLPYLEDERLAEAVWRKGDWILLPAEIYTSARRFETEGHLQRQLLNAFIMNFNAIGWEDILVEMPALYRIQAQTGEVRLPPFLDRIQQRLSALPWNRRLRLWYRTGAYVRGQAWQLLFWWKVRRRFQENSHLKLGESDFKLFDRWFDRLTDHPPGRLLSALLVWTWFQGLRGHHCRWRTKG